MGGIERQICSVAFLVRDLLARAFSSHLALAILRVAQAYGLNYLEKVFGNDFDSVLAA